MKTIVWFRQDLRVKDNPALVAAAKRGEVLAVYIHDTELDKQNQIGGASRWCLHQALAALSTSLEGKLLLFKGCPLEVLQDLSEKHQINKIVWNRMYEPWAIARDSKIKAHFKQTNIEVESYNGSLLWEPMHILKKDGSPYKVYTPYFKNGCLQANSPRYPIDIGHISFVDCKHEGISVDTLELMPDIKWYKTIESLWDISEQGAKDRLEQFIQSAIQNYQDKRNIPSIKGTSLLAPYFHFGLLSPNQAWYAVLDAFGGSMEQKGVYTYLSELGWREFSYYLLYHFNDIQTRNFNRKFDNFPWQDKQKHLKAWQQGKTGVPIVDAGMRELWQTGYMHNRVRMVVASYLVKNLLIDWRHGERWFWDCLLDADTAANSASWQWVAGSGADAAPYFRIFNPVLQGEKFDKEGEYVKKYCPELKNLAKKYIHKPWEANTDVLSQAGIALGRDYPEPLVCLKASRTKALEAYASIK